MDSPKHDTPSASRTVSPRASVDSLVCLMPQPHPQVSAFPAKLQRCVLSPFSKHGETELQCTQLCVGSTGNCQMSLGFTLVIENCNTAGLASLLVRILKQKYLPRSLFELQDYVPKHLFSQ